jgi:tetratricopeptide (TPR) repeat protein
VLWHHGQALSFEGAGFSSLAEIVRMRAGIDVKEPPDTQRTKLESLVQDVFPSDSEDRARAFRGLRRLLGLDDGRELIDLGELFSSWRLLFERLAERDPVVLLFEDLQWADQGLFDFITHLSEWASRSRILVLVFSRPDERLQTLIDHGERIDIAPLSGEDIEALIRGAVDGAPASLVSTVREHAAGVPLFAVESLRMLADRGLLIAEGDAHRYRLVGEVDDLDVPPSIHALIAARLDRLGDLERVVIRGGAVFGQRFGVSAAAALAGLGTAEARSVLDELVAKQFLEVDTDPRSQSPGTYAFVHPPVQRVVLGTLSRRERKARHLAAAEHLSAQTPDPDLAAILAGHLVAAFEAQPTAPDAVDIRRRAHTLTLDAANRAESVGALNEAVALYVQAAGIEEDELQRAGHLVHAARCAERYGNQEEIAAAHYAAARELHERAGRTREALRLRARELYVYQWRQAAAPLEDPLREVYEALRDERDAAFADAAASLASTLYANGAAEAAESIAAEAVEAAEAARAYNELGLALNLRACALIELARPTEAVEVFQAALEVRQRYAPSDVPGSLGNMAITFAALGRFDEAVKAGREAMAAAERFARRVHLNLAALQLARALFSLGRWDEAVETVEEVAAETAPAYQGMVLGPPVLVAIYRGELGRARSVLDEFDRLHETDAGAAFESDYKRLREVVLAHLAGAHRDASAVIDRAQSGDYAEWPTWLPLAIDLIVQLDEVEPLLDAAAALRRDVVPTTSPIVTAQAARVDAHLAARAGQRARAASRWSAAIKIARSAGMNFDAATLGLERFEHAPEARGALAELRLAHQTLTGLRATPWLERATVALEGAGLAHADSPKS